MVERHGLTRVRNSLFEFWSGPNLNVQFWAGSDEHYRQLYAASARDIERVQPALRIYGPASAGTDLALPR